MSLYQSALLAPQVLHYINWLDLASILNAQPVQPTAMSDTLKSFGFSFSFKEERGRQRQPTLCVVAHPLV